jgi:pre-mRNA-splicing factor SYF1
LWTALADFHIRRAAFEVARDVYEEGLAAVATVRDFGLIFDALRWAGSWIKQEVRAAW